LQKLILPVEMDAADIDFYPLDDASGSKHVRIQVETMQSAQNMTLEQYSEAKINSIEGQILESNSTTLASLPAHETVSISPFKNNASVDN
jgi:hypothetical protein